MENRYENVIWRADKKKYKGIFKVGNKSYSTGYSHDPYELYLRTQAKKKEVQEEFTKSLLALGDPGEVWKDITGCEGVFFISNFGRIKSLSNIRPGILPNNKEVLVLKQNNKTVRKVRISEEVTYQFLPHINLKDYCIVHKDGNTLNSSLNNLEHVLKAIHRENVIEGMINIAKSYDNLYVYKTIKKYVSKVEVAGTKSLVYGNSPKDTLIKAKELKDTLLSKNSTPYMHLLEGEEFREVEGTNSQYKVSNLGRLIKFNKVNWILQKGTNNKGYIKNSISYANNQRHIIGVHQLVAESFLGHTRNGNTIVVDHINHNTLDNRVENLRLVSNIENSSHKKSRKYNLPTGVTKTKSGRYLVSTGKKSKYLGTYDTPEEASNVYQEYHKIM